MKVANNKMSIADYILRGYEDKIDNSEIIDHINYIGKKNPYAVISEHENYLKGNPYDYVADIYYCTALAKIGRLEEAEQELHRIKEQYNRMLKEYEASIGITSPCEYEKQHDNAIAFTELPEELQVLWKNIVFVNLRILCNQNKLEEALIYFNAHPAYLSTIANFVMFYLRARNGEFEGRERNAGYLFNQILEYNEKDLIKITKKRQVFHDRRGDKEEYSRFREDFPVDKVLAEVKQCLPSLDGFYTGYLDKTYVFRCDNCGTAKGRIVNFFKVSVFNGTDDIYEFEPVDGYYELPSYYDFTDFVKGGKIIVKE